MSIIVSPDNLTDSAKKAASAVFERENKRRIRLEKDAEKARRKAERFTNRISNSLE